MEEVLDVYARSPDPNRPLVCLDETTKQLVRHTRDPFPLSPGRPAGYDYEYERNGVGTLFMMCAPFAGWREVAVTEQKRRVDYANSLQQLADIHFAQAEVIVLVQDNLNTHHPASLYEAFEPSEARRLIDRFEFHYTPKHGSWLNIAEIELSILGRQCLSQRIPDLQNLTREVKQWTATRNAANAGVNWQFTTSSARIKLKRLYPSIHA